MKRRKPIHSESDATRFIRSNLRPKLQALEASWKPVWITIEDDCCYTVRRNDVALINKLRLDDAPARWREPFAILLDLLLPEQAQMARVAVTIAKAELALTAGRQKGTDTLARSRSEDDARLLAEARKLRPGLSKLEKARRLSERGFGKVDTIRRKLS